MFSIDFRPQINWNSIHGGFFLITFANLIYLSLDFFLGAITGIFTYLLWILANLTLINYPDESFKWFLIIQVVGWGAQFFGHGYFEQRRPALTDNLLLVFAAPLFVVLEVFFMFGYKQELRDTFTEKVKNEQKKD